MYAELEARPIPLDLIKANADGDYEAQKSVWSKSDQAVGPTNSPPEIAREALAYFLSVEVDLQRKAGNSSARRGKYLAPTTVAWITNDLLDSCRSAPGPHLKALIRKLLNVDRLKKKQSKNADAWHAAVWIIGFFPDISSQQVADELGVNRSSVSRWRKNPSFQERILLHGSYRPKMKE